MHTDAQELSPPAPRWLGFVLVLSIWTGAAIYPFSSNGMRNFYRLTVRANVEKAVRHLRHSR